MACGCCLTMSEMVSQLSWLTVMKEPWENGGEMISTWLVHILEVSKNIRTLA